jgi:UDP-glucose:(heptosyl)LPS alpha-1,3-glucosyltransferase
MPIDIALVRAKYNPFGGAERFLNDAVAAMAGSDIRFTLFTREWPAQKDAGMQHRIVNPRYVTSLDRETGFAHAVQRALAAERFDLVQSYERLPHVDIYHAVDGVHAEWLRQRERIATGFKRWGTSINPRHRYVLRAERGMYTSPRFKAAICISAMVKNDILRHVDIDPAKLHVVYSGIDANRFAAQDRDAVRRELRAKFGIPASAPLAVYVGSGFERKGLSAFLQALATYHRNSDDGPFALVVGKDKHQAKYAALANQLGISDRVTFTGGVADTRPYYAAGDVFVLPTLYEPFGLVYLEAMAAGLPVVASTGAGAAELVREGINGFVTDALDIPAIAAAMRNGATHTHAMRAAAVETAQKFTPKAMRAQYAAIYRSLTA